MRRYGNVMANGPSWMCLCGARKLVNDMLSYLLCLTGIRYPYMDPFQTWVPGEPKALGSFCYFQHLRLPLHLLREDVL